MADLPESIQNYLKENKKTLKNRADKVRRKSAKWWNFTFAMHKEYYHLNKLWTSYRGANNCFAFDNTFNYIGLTNTTVIFDTDPKSLNLKYILSLLNSRLINFRFKSIAKQTGGGMFEYYENSVKNIPIKLISISDQKKYINLVDKIIQSKIQNSDANTKKIEKEIDMMVYHLYNLTYAEAKIIDTELSEDEFEKYKL